MKFFIFFLLITGQSYAADSKLIPLFLDAARIYSSPDKSLAPRLVWRKDLYLILNLLYKRQIPTEALQRFLSIKSDQAWPLEPADSFDQWNSDLNQNLAVPEVALHAIKLKVVEESDDYLNDDLYLYFFVTDGTVPSGKVTSVYRGLDEGDSFYLNPLDRIIYPLGMGAKSPQQHLIIDYGIMESDGDDIKSLQKLSDAVIEIAMLVYSAKDPQHSELIKNLRQEVKALAKLLLEFDDDDHLITGSFGFKSSDLESLFMGQSYVEFAHKHKKKSGLDQFEYKLHYRLIKK